MTDSVPLFVHTSTLAIAAAVASVPAAAKLTRTELDHAERAREKQMRLDLPSLVLADAVNQGAEHPSQRILLACRTGSIDE